MTDTSRNLFEYHNGEEALFADPLALTRQLHGALSGEVNKWLKRTDPQSNGPALVLEAWNKLIPACREAFALVPFDRKTGKGATDAMTVKVLHDFLAWCKKKE